jgi:hypothetical protein
MNGEHCEVFLFCCEQLRDSGQDGVIKASLRLRTLYSHRDSTCTTRNGAAYLVYVVAILGQGTPVQFVADLRSGESRPKNSLTYTPPLATSVLNLLLVDAEIQ